MIKGVNHQVVEITRPSCDYFERVIFFVKPEYSSVSHGTLRERASMIAGETGMPPKTRVKRKRIVMMLAPPLWALLGALICAACIKIF